MRDERAFGLVEVIIAAVLVSIGVLALVSLGASSGRALNGADIKRMQAEVARSVTRTLSDDQRWAAAPMCEGSWRASARPCDVSGIVNDKSYMTQRGSGREPARFRATVLARGVESPADNVGGGLVAYGATDRDGRVPDWFELDITVTQVVADGLTSSARPYQVQAVTDSATRGAGGVLVVRACRVEDQIDERIELGACTSRSSQPLAKPGGSLVGVDRDINAMATAPPWARAVTTAPVRVACAATGPDGSRVTGTTGADGSWSPATAVTPGSWTVRCDTPAGSVPWQSKTRPADGIVTVAKDRASTVVFAYQPAPVEVDIRQGTIDFYRYRLCFEGKCDEEDREVVDFIERSRALDGADLSLAGRLVPAPYGRTKVAPASSGITGMRMRGVQPGLYSGTIVTDAEQYYLYTASPGDGALPYHFGLPVTWAYVRADGSIQTSNGPTQALWQVRWWCHSEQSHMLRCPNGPTPEGRGALQIGGAGGSGGA